MANRSLDMIMGSGSARIQILYQGASGNLLHLADDPRWLRDSEVACRYRTVTVQRLEVVGVGRSPVFIYRSLEM